VVGDAGILIPPGDTRAIVEAVTGLLDNDNKRKAMGMSGKERVARLFNWDSAAKQTADYYREAIEAQVQVKTG
jgi:glycosyltransferase involved in cell wall biosynthesis